MDISDIKDIKYEKEPNGICTVTLNTPKRRNAMSFVTFLELETVLDDMKNDDNAKILILTGAEEANAFSSGGYFNMNMYTSVPEHIMDELDLQDIAVKRLCMKLWKFPKPVIAAVNGYAIGAGFTMLLAGADLIYMSKDAYIGFYFIRRAVIAEFGADFLLPFYLGFQKTKELLYFGKKISADEALELGLINEVVDPDKLMDYVREKALNLIPPNAPSLAINAMKKTMHNYFTEIVSKTLDLENERLRELFKTHDFRASLKSLVTKKEPKFKGK
ncbi:MAG: enoyl-CoA hydratase/isomerase family protein [Promethearchaeota archaeon]|nr:MAG: enoyl-CoA hydratase/isomerase family protein [Candidatus Lokiarchaeota archaeon]